MRGTMADCTFTGPRRSGKRQWRSLRQGTQNICLHGNNPNTINYPFTLQAERDICISDNCCAPIVPSSVDKLRGGRADRPLNAYILQEYILRRLRLLRGR